MSKTIAIRIHVPPALVERIDRLATQARQELGCNVSRAAVIRAALYLSIDRLNPELLSGLQADAVKRGRPAGRSEP